jgi:hypothetical protein
LLFPAQPPEAPFQVESAKPLPELADKFRQTSGWTGGDGAASIPLGPKRTLWLFADSWIGKIENGRRVESHMINNAAAWQELDDKRAAFRFFWKGSEKSPAALLNPEQAESWYWPGDGALIDGKLYLFCKVVQRRAEGAPGFQFEWFGNDLVRVENPDDEPAKWKTTCIHLPNGEQDLRLGIGCFVEGDYLYVLGLLPKGQNKRLENRAGLARISRDRLAKFDGQGWEYWQQGEKWSDRPDNPVVVFPDAAPDQGIGRVRGIDGFVTVYIPLGMGRDIVARFAAKPEGPWSQPIKLYRCPEEEKVFTYAARPHPELATKDGQIIITYCRNIGDLAEHVRRPDIYFPQAIEVQLRKK